MLLSIGRGLAVLRLQGPEWARTWSGVPSSNYAHHATHWHAGQRRTHGSIPLPVRVIPLKLGYLTSEEFDQWVVPLEMTRPS
jgi:hypothetical protein